MTTSVDKAKPLNKTTPNREKKRNHIVKVAAELFLEKGYDNVTINDVIDVAGGSKATIYSKFGGKEKLFEAVVEKMCYDVTVQINVTFTGTLGEQLERIALSFVGGVLSPKVIQFHRLMTSIGRRFPDAGRLFYDTGPRVTYGIIQTWVERHQSLGNIQSNEDPRRMAILFHDMLLGESMLNWLTSAGEEEERQRRIGETVRLAIKVFLSGFEIKNK